MVRHLLIVIKYLKGEIDLYNGKYEEVIASWDYIWDEIKMMGYDPESPDDIMQYLKEVF